MSLSQVRDLCDVSIGLVHRWVDQNGLTSTKNGRERTVKMVDLLPFLAIRYADNNAEFKDRLNAARLERLERDNRLAGGELITREEHENEMVALASLTVRALSGMPGRLAGEMAAIDNPAIARDRLAEECRGVRNGIAEQIDELVEKLAELEKETDESPE